jgi:hypothetical protein
MNPIPNQIPGEFGITAIVGPPDRPDATPEEREAARRADRITYGELRKLFPCDDATAGEIFSQPDFPNTVAFTYVGRVFTRREAVYARSAINSFLEKRRRLAKAMPAKV